MALIGGYFCYYMLLHGGYDFLVALGLLPIILAVFVAGCVNTFTVRRRMLARSAVEEVGNKFWGEGLTENSETRDISHATLLFSLFGFFFFLDGWSIPHQKKL